MKTCFVVCAVILIQSLLPIPANSHCEIPCGIYHDKLRVETIAEHITTIEKSMNMIVTLSKEADANYNQIVRWVVNKETHATYIQEIVQQYFLTQRIKAVDDVQSPEGQYYTNMLVLLHNMLIQSMKAKQTTDLKHVEKLRKLLERFDMVYFGKNKGY